MEFTVDKDALVNALLYVVNEVGQAERHRTLKMIYLADKLHLERYGAPITGDRYIKKNFGPVASATYDAIKAFSGEPNRADPELLEMLRGKLHVDGRRISALADPDPLEISPSMAECLDAVVSTYDHLDFGSLTDLTHDEAWHSADEHKPIPAEAIVRTLPRSEILLEYLRDPYPES